APPGRDSADLPAALQPGTEPWGVPESGYQDQRRGSLAAQHQGEDDGDLRSYLRSTQKCQDVVRRFFRAPPVRYAAA
ncbi:MAG TPA: hypothetical protein VFA32_16005, partial [Dehalococcoidia bacterium]|nr:hypothetical protein [Dehalococcoidia bacterium]